MSSDGSSVRAQRCLDRMNDGDVNKMPQRRAETAAPDEPPREEQIDTTFIPIDTTLPPEVLERGKMVNLWKERKGEDDGPGWMGAQDVTSVTHSVSAQMDSGELLKTGRGED